MECWLVIFYFCMFLNRGCLRGFFDFICGLFGLYGLGFFVLFGVFFLYYSICIIIECLVEDLLLFCFWYCFVD